ncbi:hypothetical protein SAMN04489735_1004154 [Aneurinibacillus thermoaerophilus]|uniref:Uncharacterized protein n=2 Tax=Aneurinibacillus group TaxID=85151 RepID=A0A1G7XRU9_ANETH|nr:hypothetical protein SAMN04489735_1004154 [Aneurinibacillus thermoaerophilus]
MYKKGKERRGIELKKKIGKYLILYMFILTVFYLGFMKYQQHVAASYLTEFQALHGEEVIEQISTIYKDILEYQARYKLTPQVSAQLAQNLLVTGKKLKDVDQKLKQKYPHRHVDFSYLYQDLFLVVKQLQDKANDTKLGIMVVHAVEGLGNVKVQIYSCKK